MKREIDRALKLAGGTQVALAQALGVSSSTIRRWRKGLKSKKSKEQALAKLATFFDVVKRGKSRKKTDRTTFEALMSASGEIGALPKVRTHEGRRSGPKTIGYQWTKAFGRMLTPDLVREIQTWLRSLGKRKRYSNWQAVALVAQFMRPEHDFKGYQTVKQPQLHQEKGTGDFHPQLLITTSKSTRLTATIKSIGDELFHLSDVSINAYVHAATLYNYNPRNEAERSAYWRNRDAARRRRAKSRGRRKKR